MIKSILIAAALVAAFFSPPVQAQQTPEDFPGLFVQRVGVRTVCTKGGPEMIFSWLLRDYNEKPIHALDVAPVAIMYITENKNNPSSSVVLFNKGQNQTCLFWTSPDYLRTIEAESLPAKKPKWSKGETDA